MTVAWTGYAPTSLIVDRDPDAVVNALRTDPEWASKRTSSIVQGVEVHEWEPGCDLGAATFPDRPRGCGQAIAVDDGMIMRAGDHDHVVRMLDARRRGTAMADDPTVVALVESVADQQVHVARMMPRPAVAADVHHLVTEEAVAAWRQVPPPNPYQGWGVGITDDDRAVLVVVHEDAAAAAAVGTLDVILHEMTAMDGGDLDRYATVGEVRAEGRAVVADLQMTPESILVSWRIPLELYLLPSPALTQS